MDDPSKADKDDSCANHAFPIMNGYEVHLLVEPITPITDDAKRMIEIATERWKAIPQEQREVFINKFSEIFNERIKWDNSEWTAEEYVEIEEKGIDITGHILLSRLRHLVWWDMYDEFDADMFPPWAEAHREARDKLWAQAGFSIISTEPGYKVAIEALDEMGF